MAKDPSSAPAEVSSTMLIRRVVFIAALLVLAFHHMFLDFNGLSHAQGMDQAQIAREISRKNGFSTKNISPLALNQVIEHRKKTGEGGVPLQRFQDVHYAPLNPILNSAFFGLFKKNSDVKTLFDPEAGGTVYFLDRVVMAVSVILLIGSIGISYLLVSRIFDTRIGGVTAVLMALCSLMWDFSKTGLPQMLMLFLFSFGCYFVYRAVEMSQENNSRPYIWIALAGGFFVLLALTHWIAFWPFLGLVVFAAFYFRPRGAMALILLALFVGVTVLWGMRNSQICGNPLGSGFEALKIGLSDSTPSSVFRDVKYADQGFQAKGLFGTLVANSVRQFSDIYKFLGAIAAAPLFFLSLIHPFKRREIADFRWCILSMWLFSVVGMTIYGIPEGALDPNQIHLLFAPIMAGYGLAFLTVIWNRLGLESQGPLAAQGHLIIVVLISAIPLLFNLPRDVKRGISTKSARANWPPYHPPGLALLNEWVDEEKVIVSDMPWAVAWYSDRNALWLPKDREQFRELYDYAEENRTPFAGVLFSPVTLNSKMITEISKGEYRDWRELIMWGEIVDITKSRGPIPPDFPFQIPNPTFGRDMGYFFADKDYNRRTRR